MVIRRSKAKVLTISLLIAAITFFHYSTELGAHHYHVFYQGLYFLPVLLAGLWFGLRGGVAASLSITILYLPFTVIHWKAFSSEDFNNLLEMVLYNLVAVILGILRDREKKEQIRLREAESLAAVGKAVSTVAHELKNPLVAIGGFSRLVKKHLPKNHPYRDKIDIIIEEGRRLEKLVKEILDFSRPPNLQREKGDMKGIIDQTLAIVSYLAEKKNVGVSLQPPPNLSSVSLDSERLMQAFINLLTNAIDASPEGEKVIVSMRQRARSIVVDVTDHGPGIPRSQRKEIFSLFFTTKRHGTGLGLAITKNIIEAHRGSVEVLDNPDKGVTFRVTLPAD
jgi:two-component system sensor histidine kinase HydH